MIIKYCSAPCASGKTYQLLRLAIEMVRKGHIVLILQPTIELIDRTMADLRQMPDAPPCRAFYSKNGEGKVGLRLAEYLKDQADEGQILFGTHSVLEHIYWVDKKRVHLLVDETFQIVSYNSLKIADTHRFITDEFDVDAGNVAYGQVIVKDKQKFKRFIKNKNKDEILERFNPTIRLLLKDHWRTQVHLERYAKFMAGAGEQSLDFYSELMPGLFSGFASVFMTAANFEQSMLFKLWSQRGVEFIEDTSFKSSLRYSEHVNGHLIDIRYMIEDDWSKNIGTKIIDDVDVLKRMSTAATELFRQREYVWHANKDCPADLFLDAGRRLPSVPHGLNSYASIHNIVFLSALNPRPDQSKFLESLGLSRHEVRQFTYYESAYQAVMRTSLRSLASTEPVTVLVPDRGLAEHLAGLFPGANVSRLDAGIPQMPMKKKGGQRKKYHSAAERGVAQRRAVKQKKLVALQARLTGSAHNTSLNNCIPNKENTRVDWSIESIEANCMGVFHGSILGTKNQLDPDVYLNAPSVDSFVEALYGFHLGISTKDLSPLISPSFYDSSLVEGKSRGRENIVYCRHLWIDIENGDLTPKQFESLFPSLKMVVTNTYRHTNAKPRYRVIIFTNTIMSPDAYEAIMKDIRWKLEEAGYSVGSKKQTSKKLKSGFDVSKASPTSLFSIPGQADSSKESFFVYHNEGRQLLNVEHWLNNLIVIPEADHVPLQPNVSPIVDDALVEAATADWLATPQGEGSSSFFRFGLKLRTAGLGYLEINSTLFRQAANSRSPHDRRRQIPSIIEFLKKGTAQQVKT